MRRLLYSVLVALGIFFALPLHATHIVGGELSYTYLGNDSFLITLDMYRDCGNINNETFETNYVNIGIIKDDGLYFYGTAGVSVTDMRLYPVGVFDTIPNNINGDPCLFVPPNVCVQHARYQNKFKLSTSQGIYITYQRCCRNQTVTNIVDPLNTGATYFVYISPQAKLLHNSSPRFGFYPPVFVCVNHELEQPNAATDLDGDSLVYKFYTPYKGATNASPTPTPDLMPYGPPYAFNEIQPPPYDTVVWKNPPYSLNQMLGPSSTPFSINSSTGLITGFPQIQGRFVVGVLVEEYRNGQLLSILRRDFQYEVGVCAELDVEIVAPEAQCDDLTVHFGNNTDVAQNFVWYFDWPNPTPTSTVKEPTYTFPDTGTYVVALVAEPVGQCVDTAFHTIFLQYNSLTPNFSVQNYDCTNQSVLVLQDLSVDNVSPVTSWHWDVAINGVQPHLTSDLQNPSFQVPNPSTGTVTLTVTSVNGCEQTKTLQFTTGGNNPVVNLPDTVSICKGETAFLNPVGNVPGFTFHWGPPVPAAQQDMANPSVSPLQNTNYTVTITGYAGLCQSTKTVFVHVYTPVQLAFTPDADCDGHVVKFVNQSQFAPFGYVWNFGDPTTTADVSTLATPTYTYPSYGTYTVTLMTAPNAVCKDTIQQDVTVAQKTLTPDFTYQYNGCSETAVSVKFFDQTINSEGDTNGWMWTFSGVYTGTSVAKNPLITVQQEGWIYVTLKVNTSENCTATTALDSLYIDFTELPNLVDGSSVIGCLNGGVTLNEGGDPSYNYVWSPAIPGCSNCPSPHVNPAQTTIYTVSVTNPNGADSCTIVRHITVIVTPNVNLVATPDVTTCNETTTLSATTGLLPVQLSWFDENGTQIAGNVSSITVDVSGYDYYVVRAEDTQGCYWYDTTHVVGGPADIEAVGDQIKCSNEPLDIYATNLDQNDTLSWQWTPVDFFTGPTNVPHPTVLVIPGARFLYVEATNQFGCSATDSVYMAVVDTANVLDFEYLAECNGNTVQFINTSTNAFNYSWDFGDPTATDDTSHLDNPVYIYPAVGTYTVRLTMDFNLACVDTLVKDISILSTQFVPNFTYEYLACDVDSVEVQFHDATSILQAGVTIDSFFWESSNGDTSSLPNPVFTVYAGQDFQVTMHIFTNNDCDGSVTKELKLEFIEIEFDSTVVLCSGDSTELNPNGNTGYIYHWTPNIAISNPDVANPTVWPTQTTTYTVEITNFSPDTCSVTRTITVFVPEKIEVTAPNDTLTCGSLLTLCATANLQGLNYQWFETGNLLANGACLTTLPSSDTEFEVVATDQYGCHDEDLVFVANEEVRLNWVPVGAECPDENVQLTVNNLVADHNLTYLWTATVGGQVLPPVNEPTVTAVTPPANQAANYTVTATNQFGCTNSLTQAISSYNFVPTVVQSVDVCPGVGEPLNPGANPNLTYMWSPGIGLDYANVPNPIVTVSQSTIYTVTVSDDFGLEHCEEVIQVNVNSAPVINITETVDTFTCGTTPIIISAQVNVPVDSLKWTNAAGEILGTEPTLSVDPDDLTLYIVTVKDAFGCSAKDTVAVDNNQLDIVLDGNGIIDTCPMPNYNICVTNEDINDVLTYEWTTSNGGTIISGDTTACPTVTSEQGVTSNFTVVVTNQFGCSETREFNIETYNFNPVVQAKTDICPSIATNINPQAEGSDLTYTWSPSTGLSCTNCPNPSATLDASQTYQVLVQGFNGEDTCSFMQTVQVNVTPQHNLIATPEETILCDSSDVVLTASYNSPIINAVAWSNSLDFEPPLGTNPTLTVTPSGTMYYYVQTTDTLGCHDTAQVVIHAYPVDISIGDAYNFCEEIGTLTIPLTNFHPDQVLSFDWTPTEYIDIVNPDGSAVVTNLMSDQMFYVTATNLYGCTDQDSAFVEYYDIEPTLGQITSTEDTIYYNSGEFSQLGIEDIPGYIYQWSPEEGLDDATIPNPKATPAETTTYTLTVTDEGDCAATRQVTIVVLNPDCDEPNLFLPNAFTPNGDGNNDVLYFRSNIVAEMELAIYNRWGQRIFYSESQNEGWDGTFKGEKLTPDVYGYYLHAKCYNGQDYFKKGNVTLLR